MGENFSRNFHFVMGHAEVEILKNPKGKRAAKITKELRNIIWSNRNMNVEVKSGSRKHTFELRRGNKSRKQDNQNAEMRNRLRNAQGIIEREIRR